MTIYTIVQRHKDGYGLEWEGTIKSLEGAEKFIKHDIFVQSVTVEGTSGGGMLYRSEVTEVAGGREIRCSDGTENGLR